ncbi:MAG: hypothetical protein A2W90_22450 [Bacteroidetes bacterium GWF2_42_66]|nr:MAG: hypothetical protein A2W92_21855 [Bacteroidetes bacterium GWA2_42_15]OFY03096.1 MAG: hypothetical protein A2W89_13230 [Bacteroidetes bacterium GWE2_42_39]OFY45204.1 MAG: hypothetical protein A2W90_22450 [Bacteroidetes bacterium GWF2_42_66]HBL74143.1 hypothetical protein [Prolixibacteraceae bacterium]HCR90598.1 hypothetical protein [Prolixibacteraceae bacterium]
MENKVPVYKIIRNIASKGAEYADETREWLDGSNENKQIYQDLLNLWQVTGAFPGRFHPDRPQAWRKVQKQIHARERKYFIYRRVAQIAAAIVIVFLSVWTGTKIDNLAQPNYTEVISPAGQKTRIILPDSSTVLLNGGSRIRYSQNFSKQNRNVELQGEGYFDVRKDLHRQFIVNTSGLNVKVFGTSFNVKAYENDPLIEIGLKSGSIGIDRDNTEIVQLVPGQVATFNKNEKQLNVVKMNVDLVSAWTRDEMIFEENSLEEIVKYMERWYGVNILLAPELQDGELLTLKVKTESLQELLEMINLLKPIGYKVDGKQVIITKP